MNKKEAKAQLSKLQKEIDKLTDIINKSDDLFSITTYTEICEQLGIREKIQSEFDTIREYKYHQIQNIQRLYNGDSVNNYYYPYFRRTGSGLVFGVSDYSDNNCSGQVAYYKDSKTSDYVGKIFTDIYNNLK